MQEISFRNSLGSQCLQVLNVPSWSAGPCHMYLCGRRSSALGHHFAGSQSKIGYLVVLASEEGSGLWRETCRDRSSAQLGSQNQASCESHFQGAHAMTANHQDHTASTLLAPVSCDVVAFACKPQASHHCALSLSTSLDWARLFPLAPRFCAGPDLLTLLAGPCLGEVTSSCPCPASTSPHSQASCLGPSWTPHFPA